MTSFTLLLAKGLGRCIFQTFKEPKIQNFGNQGTTSRLYWTYHKPPILSYSEVGTYISASFCKHGRYLQSQVFKYITEKCYDSDVNDVAFLRIYQAKVNIFSGTEGASNIILWEQYQLEINILRNKNHLIF